MRSSGFSAGKVIFALTIVFLAFWLLFVGNQDESTTLDLNRRAAEAVGLR